jgi:uncharacterized protein YndB with AHSA1/START domain
MERHDSVTVTVAASPADVFDLITDLDRLPEWNHCVEKVLDKPVALERGAEWVVQMHAIGTRWPSRSRAHEVDRRALRFSCRSQSDDGNPSSAEWAWEVEPTAGGTKVTVKWDLYPRTLFRKLLAVRVRHHMLNGEVATSLAAIDAVARSSAQTESTQ